MCEGAGEWIVQLLWLFIIFFRTGQRWTVIPLKEEQKAELKAFSLLPTGFWQIVS